MWMHILNPNCCVKITSVLTELKIIMKIKTIKEEEMTGIWKSVHLFHKYCGMSIPMGKEKSIGRSSIKSADSVYLSERALWDLLTLRFEYWEGPWKFINI